MIRLFFVAFRRMKAVSLMSTMKVLCPRARSSDAPTRVKILSHTESRAEDAGTKDPICAIRQISATCRMYVLLPAMFGPVMIIIRFSSVSSNVSLGTKPVSRRLASTTGWRPSWKLMLPSGTISGRT